ncbi:MAG: ATP synthase F1 subunit delta [Ignavibacteriaceae bacterium]|nr:ATP synthase F1 subunit delta [Ignavibacteriaceae bacterium]NUM70006.1 ATP synthase F1 subunit delta [Ignavibacteriaceae bacterium]
MVLNKVAHKYAESFLEDIKGKGLETKLKDEAVSVVEIITGSKPLNRVIENPVIKAESKVNILKALFAGKVDDNIIGLFEFLGRKERIDMVTDVLRSFREKVNQKLGITDVKIKSAFEMDSKQLSSIVTELEKVLGKKVTAEIRVDPEIIGGIIVDTGDKVIDASVSSKLQRLRKNFTNLELVSN